MRQVGFHNVTVNVKKGSALLADKTTGLDLSGFKSLTPLPKTPVVELRDVRQVFIHGCTAAPDTHIFVRVQEMWADEVVLGANNFKTAAQTVVRVKEAK